MGYIINGSGQGGSSLPTATDAGQVPLSSGAGTTYTAADFGATMGAAMGGLVGSVAGKTVIGDGAGGVATTSADVSAMLAASSAAAARTALGAQGTLISTAYVLGGAVTDYTLDAAYAPAGLGALAPLSASGDLGDGVTVPRFFAVAKNRIAALARTATGIRLTVDSASSQCIPQGEDGATIVVRLPSANDFTLDFTLESNCANYGLAGGEYLITRTTVVQRGSGTVLWGTPESIAESYLYTTGAVTTFGVGASATDVSATVAAGIVKRSVRVIQSGCTLEVLDGPDVGSLTRRSYTSQYKIRGAHQPLGALILSLSGFLVAKVGCYIELQALSVAGARQ